MTLQDKLIELNRMDKRVRGLRTRLDGNMRRKGIQQRKLDQLNQQHAELDGRVKAHRAALHNLETEAAAMDERVEKLRAQMNEITTNKEYQAVLVEVNTLKLEKSKKDDEALAEMTVVEELQTQLDTLTTQRDGQAKLVEQADADVAASREEIAESLAAAEAEFRAAAADVPRPVLMLYAKLSDDNDGDAIGYVEEYDRKRHEYTCSVSNVVLPPDVVNGLITQPEVVQQCPASGVILVVSAETRESMLASK